MQFGAGGGDAEEEFLLVPQGPLLRLPPHLQEDLPPLQGGPPREAQEDAEAHAQEGRT